MADTPETPLFKCTTCSTAFSGIIPYRDHMKSKKHAEKVKNKGYEAEVGKDGEIIASNGDGDETPRKKSQFRCDDCDKDFSGPIPYVQHVNGQGHYRVLRNKILSETAMSLTSSINSLIQHNVAAEEAGSDKNAHLQQDDHKPEDELDSVPQPKVNKTAENNADAPAPVSKAIAKVTPEKSVKKKAEALQTSPADNRPSRQLNFNPSDLRCDLCNMRSFMSVHDMMLHFESDAHRFNRMQQQVRQLEELSLNDEQNGSASSHNSSMEKIDYADVAE